MAFKFTKCCTLEGTCMGIEVPIARHSDEDFEVLCFEEPLSIKEAVKRGEKYLSEPLTKEHYLKVQALEDWWYDQPFEEYEGTIRGDLLGYLIFLEGVEINEDSIAMLILGS